VAPCGGHGRTARTPSSYRDRRGAHGALRPRVGIPRGDRRVCDAHIVLTSVPPPRTSVRRGRLLGQPRCRRLALRLADGARTRCSRPTLPTHVYVREPVPRSSPGVDAPGSPLFHGQPTRFGGPHARGARPSLWRPCRPIAWASHPLARTTLFRLGQARRRRDRVTDHGGGASRDAFHPARALALRHPFGASGSDLLLDARQCDRLAASIAMPLHPARPFRAAPERRSPCTRPLPSGIALLGPRLRLPTSADFFERRAGSPRRAFDPRSASRRGSPARLPG